MSWRLDPTQSGVLLVDLQERLMPAIAEGERVARKAADLLGVAEIFALPVFVTEQVPAKLGPTLPGLELARRGITPIPKSAFSAASALPEALPKIVLVAGVETHVCVRQTVYDLRLGGRTVYVIADAAGSRHPGDHRLALEEMRQDKILTPSLEAVAWELAGSAESPHFKRLLGLLK